MPTFEQIEELQTQRYIHRKTGWDLVSLDTIADQEHGDFFEVIFSKNDKMLIVLIRPDQIVKINPDDIKVDD